MKTPPILLAYGGDEYRLRRFVRGVRSQYETGGFTPLDVSGDDHGHLSQILSTTGVVFDNKVLCVIQTKADKVPVSLLTEHGQDKDPVVVLFLVLSGVEKPPAVLTDHVPKSATRVFGSPPFYKLEDFAVDFVQDEVKSLGCTIAGDLATALVRKVGTDLGTLDYEVLKACHLTKAGGGKDVTPAIVRLSMAPLVESDGTTVVEALGARNARRLCQELDRYRFTKGGDPTIELCGRVLSPTVLRWLQAAHMSESGVSPGAAAGRIGSNPWYWENRVLPQARAWGVRGSYELLRVIAQAQGHVFQGSLSPWTFLESGLLRCCAGTKVI